MQNGMHEISVIGSGRTSKFLCTYLGCALKEHQRALLHTETAIHIADSIEVVVLTDEAIMTSSALTGLGCWHV